MGSWWLQLLCAVNGTNEEVCCSLSRLTKYFEINHHHGCSLYFVACYNLCTLSMLSSSGTTRSRVTGMLKQGIGSGWNMVEAHHWPCFFLFWGWYVMTWALGIYHLNFFIAFLSPKVDSFLTEDSGRVETVHVLCLFGESCVFVYFKGLPLFYRNIWNTNFWNCSLRVLKVPRTLAIVINLCVEWLSKPS